MSVGVRDGTNVLVCVGVCVNVEVAVGVRVNVELGVAVFVGVVVSDGPM